MCSSKTRGAAVCRELLQLSGRGGTQACAGPLLGGQWVALPPSPSSAAAAQRIVQAATVLLVLYFSQRHQIFSY
jgi:hypothetical protein